MSTVNGKGVPELFMNVKRSQITVKAFQLQNILLEQYTYSKGAVEPLPKHSHQEYQLGMSFNCQGEYFYRGAYHPIPVGNLSMIHSGEIHSPSERTYLPQSASFWMMHVEPTLLKDIALEIADNLKTPFFTNPVLRDRPTIELFQNLCLAIKNNSSRLKQDSSILDFFARIITQNQELDLKFYSPEKPAVAIVCDYLQANYADNISLNELADLVGMSRFY
ncbi:MAG: AraC family ligand binding domain-containing protein, partial [Cyanobacteria bacterium P01_E01_bin.35]